MPGIVIVGVGMLDVAVLKPAVLENLTRQIAILLMEMVLVFIQMMHNVPVRLFYNRRASKL